MKSTNTTSGSTSASPTPAVSSQPREWMPRIWEGCNLRAWFRLLYRNRCAVAFRYWYIACIITMTATFHEILRGLQWLRYGSRIDHTPIQHAPLFIIGHWRTGTTLLHELLILDQRHHSPNTYQCLSPHHFLLTESLFKRLFWFLMPTRRPMDNMAVGWDKPQEDEFALCMLGVPSPYLTIAFPNHPPQDQEAFDLEQMPAPQLARWKKTFLRFLSHLTFQDSRRLILKSPTHSCRLPVLLELFPDARFVHIVRDPRVVFPSTVNLWKSLHESHGMQKPSFQGLEEYVFTTFNHLYERIEIGKSLVPAGRYHELRYEDLINNPILEMERLYTALGLNDFETVKPALEQYLEERAEYKTNRYRPLEPALEAQIEQRWGKVIQQFGYTKKA